MRFLNSSQGKGNVLPFGPECIFRGKRVPCLIQWSKHGGVTATILTNCLRHMDKLELFQRTDSLKPFILLDGHSSRFDLELVDYIRDKEHPWSVCIGLPYGTHIWQVGDSPQQNGNFKFYQTAMKEKILEEKKANNVASVFSPTDIIPIINYAWDRSFARTESNKTAIIERGWNPLNYALLTSAEVLRTQINTKEKSVSATDEITDSTEKTTSEIETEIPLPSSLIEAITDDVSFEKGVAAEAIDTIVKSSLARIKQQQISRKKNTETLDKTKKLTSGVAFHRGCVGLHSDTVFGNLTGYHAHKKKSEKEKRNKTKIASKKLKTSVDAIRCKQMENWTVADIRKLLTYKKDPKDVAFGNAKRATLIQWWTEREGRTSPSNSPYNSDKEE